MAEEKKSGGMNPALKWGIIIGGIILVVLAILAVIFIFVLPSFTGEGAAPPDIPEVLVRMAVVFGVFLVFIIMVGALAYAIWALLFKKKEIHIVKEHAKIIMEAAQLNPVSTLGSIVMSGRGRIQHYTIGKIVGHTQVPVKFERYHILSRDGVEMPELSELPEEFEARVANAKLDGKDRYDFFAFITKKGVYALPILSLLEPLKIFACYPCERSPDLVGDVEIFDVGTWKYYSIFVPAQRAMEPLVTLEDFKSQLMPIAMTSVMDYVGLVAQRGIEGDTSMQKWLESKASLVNIKQTP